jgi:L-threonylcarbamoyladenylate synthase
MGIMRADDAGARAAVEVLGAGGVVVVPTDTVYGLAASPAEPRAVAAVYRIKDRPEGLHLPVLAASATQVRALGVSFPPAAEALSRRWWPGPLTLVFGFDERLHRPGWLEGRAEVAVRVPGHGFLRELLEQTGVLLVTSANLHGDPTPLAAQDVAAALGESVDLILDGGTLHDVPSTLVNVRGPEPSVEREGAISRAAITGVLQETG